MPPEASTALKLPEAFQQQRGIVQCTEPSRSTETVSGFRAVSVVSAANSFICVRVNWILLPHLECRKRPVVAEVFAEELAEESLVRADLRIA